MSESTQSAQEPPKVLSRHALAARRLLGDHSVTALYQELESQFLMLAINGPDPHIREQNRLNLTCLQGLFTTLQQIAQNNLPPFMREKEEQIQSTLRPNGEALN